MRRRLLPRQRLVLLLFIPVSVAQRLPTTHYNDFSDELKRLPCRDERDYSELRLGHLIHYADDAHDDHGDGLHFQPPPARAARAPEAEARAESK